MPLNSPTRYTPGEERFIVKTERVNYTNALQVVGDLLCAGVGNMDNFLHRRPTDAKHFLYIFKKKKKNKRKNTPRGSCQA